MWRACLPRGFARRLDLFVFHFGGLSLSRSLFLIFGRILGGFGFIIGLLFQGCLIENGELAQWHFMRWGIVHALVFHDGIAVIAHLDHQHRHLDGLLIAWMRDLAHPITYSNIGHFNLLHWRWERLLDYGLGFVFALDGWLTWFGWLRLLFGANDLARWSPRLAFWCFFASHGAPPDCARRPSRVLEGGDR